ncbi:DrmB family protein [Nocardia sp. R16R-3T]
MTVETDTAAPIHDTTQQVDPLGDAASAEEKGIQKNRAKVGSARPSSLIYTYGPGSVMDLPNFTIMPTGLDEWNRIWAKGTGTPPTIHAPRLRAVVRRLIKGAHRDIELRPFPREASKSNFGTEENTLGVPARIFPQWLRCTSCDKLAPLGHFGYKNTHPFRTDLAQFEHKCRGRKGAHKKVGTHPAVPARYLLACAHGHVDEFPYELWVHRGRPCTQAVLGAAPLTMSDRSFGKGAVATITCGACGLSRAMNEAQGEAAKEKLPRCRGRHPHLDAFYPCDNEVRLILVGASNLWFPATQSVIVMPEKAEMLDAEVASRIRNALGDRLTRYAQHLDFARDALADKNIDVTGYSDARLVELMDLALAPPEEPAADQQQQKWDPIDLLVPEWRYLQTNPLGDRHQDEQSGLTLSTRNKHQALPPQIDRVLAVESLRKVNALIGFTRIDEIDRVDDLPHRMVPLARDPRPTWTVAAEDRGEGIFLQFDEGAVAAWERRTENSGLWDALCAAHKRNFDNRHSDTAAEGIKASDRMRPPRYWLLHTFAHILIREMAMTCGYNAASLSERLYAWQATDEGREPAAGVLICTTASDSDGTLGGLVELSREERLHEIVIGALRRAQRCSSDPICARRTPKPPEDFLHGAACHCCAMASETSCERANRFLDRRFLIDLPGSRLGFFQLPG